MKVLRHIFILAASAAAAAAFPSCHDNDAAEPNPATLYDVCDVEEVASDRAVFHLFRPDADTPVVLTAGGGNPVSSSGNAPEEGESVIIAYTPANGEPYTSGNITLHSWAPISNLVLMEPKPGNTIPSNWNSGPVWLMSLWRGGGKLYMRVKLPYNTSGNNFVLLLDPDTKDDAVPEIYLYHADRSEQVADRQFYIAFDISALWDRAYVEGICVHVANAANPAESTFLIKKS